MKTIKNTFSIAVIIAASIFVNTTATAQISPYKFNQFFNNAFGLVIDGNYQDALPVLERLYISDADNGQVAYLYGVCRMKVNAADYALTREVLEVASQKFDFQHQYGQVNDRTAPIKVWFYLAEVYANQNLVDKAIESYRNYMSCIQMASLDHKRMVKDRIAALKEQKEDYSKVGESGTLANLQP